MSCRHAAALAMQLPAGSRTLTKIDEENGFSNAEWLLLSILNTLRGAFGAKPIDPFAKKGRGMSAEEYADYLSRPREEVGYGD